MVENRDSLLSLWKEGCIVHCAQCDYISHTDHYQLDGEGWCDFSQCHTFGKVAETGCSKNVCLGVETAPDLDPGGRYLTNPTLVMQQ